MKKTPPPLFAVLAWALFVLLSSLSDSFAADSPRLFKTLKVETLVVIANPQYIRNNCGVSDRGCSLVGGRVIMVLPPDNAAYPSQEWFALFGHEVWHAAGWRHDPPH